MSFWFFLSKLPWNGLKLQNIIGFAVFLILKYNFSKKDIAVNNAG